MDLTFLLHGLGWFQLGLFLAVALAGFVGAGLAATTREDAFEAGDRQPKWIWVGMLVLSALLVVLGVPFLSWIGLVLIGLYWWDVRPQLRGLINGGGGW